MTLFATLGQEPTPHLGDEDEENEDEERRRRTKTSESGVSTNPGGRTPVSGSGSGHAMGPVPPSSPSVSQPWASGQGGGFQPPEGLIQGLRGGPPKARRVDCWRRPRYEV